MIWHLAVRNNMASGRLEAPLRDRRPFVTRSLPIILFVSAAGDLARSSLALGTAGFELVLQQSYRAEFGMAASLSPPNNRAAARRQRDVWSWHLAAVQVAPSFFRRWG
jgi:hypothetical protein